ncbi:hypothetical protein EON66_11125 [archaeon]|nr:MAG: hypothetical protein EON66_11125 [archaeon]
MGTPRAGAGTTDVPWKVLVLTEVDRLTTEAQAALRRTMESYTATCRLVLIASSLSKVIDPLRSRCLCMRVPAPSQPEVMSVLSSIATAEGLDVHVSVLSRIAKQANNNLRRYERARRRSCLRALTIYPHTCSVRARARAHVRAHGCAHEHIDAVVALSCSRADPSSCWRLQR